jgi:hypothetical protein
MIITPDKNGWSFDDSFAWKLVYEGNVIVFFSETKEAISTQSILFVGTQQECEEHINLLNLVKTDADEEILENENTTSSDLHTNS